MDKYSSFAAISIGFTVSILGCGTEEATPKSEKSVGGDNAQTGGVSAVGGAGTTTTPGGASNDTAGRTGAGGASAAGNGSSATGGADTSVSTANCTDTAILNATLTGQYNGATVAVSGKEATKTYQATTNWWHKYTDQTVALNGLGYVVNNPNNVSVPQTDGAPIGYPTIFIGTYSGSATKGSNLPKKVSDLTNVHTLMETNSLSLDTSNFNAAYDVWFTATSSPLPTQQYNPGSGGAYLMVWLFDPASRQPRGRNSHPAHPVAGVEGTWDVWIDPSNPPCISYVSTTPLNSLAFDLNDFIKDIVTNGYGITNDMYLSVVFSGFEIWGGGDGLTLKKFCAEVK